MYGSIIHNIMKRKDFIARVYTYASVGLAVVLVMGKLLGWFTLSWLWALAPIWINVVLALALVIWANIYMGTLFKKDENRT